MAFTMVAALPGVGVVANDPENHGRRQLVVMTQNLYLGSSLDQALAATSPDGFVAAVTQIYENVVATNFLKRAEAIADTVAADEPDLIGLQEVSRWTVQSIGGGPRPESFDFLAILMAGLASRGLDYRVVAVSENADIGPLPLVAPRFGCATLGPPPSCVVTLQDRDVILVNDDTAHLQVRRSRTGHYAAQEALHLPTGANVSFARGWAYVNGIFAGKRFRFVDTHLEQARFAATQEAQAHEFLAGPASAARTVIATGDFNSAADPGVRSTTTYEDLTAAGFTDVWPRVNPDDPGPTCCQSSTLTNTGSQLRTRIDLVLTRGPVRPKSAAVVGTTRISTSTPPFWPSDHAGVAAKLRLRAAGPHRRRPR
jgi:endonuclease/exonuclease/phosphatase family metal-dependent hydrolase